ncbi:unnamed protein product [Clonostachys chloroleuca]|uniref:Heterokaryon incompatibility domain-containing protein n=1 Tax=Clonostachys chloroleuca TaxID=1926264 RepID=A0AA35LPR5_9HYPO|nr:unnamed protein product [Clonostachys chloroleuca]
MSISADPRRLYRALPDGYIRLLLIEPSADRDARVECHLAPTQIGDRPYEALSYVWGLEDASLGILVDNEEMLIRPNLHGALKELRLTDEPRTLWVDSICIDQSNIADKTQQIKQMATIYSSAAQVVVWLGEHDDDTEAALDFIQGLSNLDPATAQVIVDNENMPWELRKRVFNALGMKHGIDNYDEVVGGLVRLMENTWWTRIWTVQEIVLAESATLRCGAKSASWDNLSKLAAFALEVAHHNTLDLGRPMDEAIFDEVTARVSKLYISVGSLNSLSHRIAQSLDIPLEQMIGPQLLTRRATNPLDVIYALLGMVTEKSVIEIDYGMTKKQVYTSTMKAMLERGTRLLPLHLLQDCYMKRDASLPSWVPDFEILHSYATINLATSGVGTTLAMASLYNASLGDATDQYVPQFLGDDNDVLQVEGVSVDQVASVGNVCPRFPDGWEKRSLQLQTVVGQWRELIPRTTGEYIGGGSVIEAFWRTVTFDLELTDRDYLAGNPNRRDKRLPRGALGMPPTTAAEEAEILEGIVDAPPPKTVLEKLGERRLFTTKSGYFGLGPASTQPGDTVCILRSALFPIVVRPTTDDRCIIIGHGFVHGIMYGEIINSLKEGRSSRQVFEFV